MNHRFVTWGKQVGLLVAAALAVASVQLPAVAHADSMPPDPTNPTTPATVAADPLPTVQIDGVAWTQKVVGQTVYVGGEFTTARPAGSAAGVNTVTRSNLLAYNIATGVLNTSWAPTTNGAVQAITASPDGSRIYVGGAFTQVNGQVRSRIAALDPTTGALISSFQPKPDATVKAIVATADTVYLGGIFSNVGGVARTKVASVTAANGALLSWAPNLQGGSVRALIMSPDKSKIIIGGSFTTTNGSGSPGYGLAAVDPSTGANGAFPANNLIRNGGANAAITSLSSDADSLYVTGYVYGSGGNLEGTSRINWSDLSIVWVEDCHGDTYAAYPKGDAIYAVSHAHYCGNLPDGFPQTSPWTFHWATAFSKAVAGVLKADPLGYYNWAGNPSPNLLKYLPVLVSGTYTGQSQAGWTITGNDKYVVVGGEFPKAGGVGQQGLVRYAVTSIAPNKVGPEVTGARFNPTVTSYARGTVKLSWLANWDRDNEKLTYTLVRNSNTASPVFTVDQLSSEWKRPAMGFLDTGLTPGATYKYRLSAKDPLGNEVKSDTVSVTVATDGDISTYAQDVLDDGAADYWRLGESSGTAVTDWAGYNNATTGSGVTRGAAGAIQGDTNTAATFDGTNAGTVYPTASQVAPDTFSAESWFKTTTTSGGKILGFGDVQTGGDSSNYDRQVYMNNSGKLTFGVYANGTQTLQSTKTYNDGSWHHVVATLGSNGMVLYVDGARVGSRTDTTVGQPFTGYWRIGGDNLNGWPDQPSSNYFAGAIDDVAVYPTVLTLAQVQDHYTDSGRTVPGSTAPADSYGKAVYNADPDLYWRLGESSGTTAADAGRNQQTGSYNGGVTFGATSGVGVDGDHSVTLDGNDGAVASNVSTSNPTTYSEELWFNTTTTRGGKLIGFGSSQVGGSGGYDRHVYMFDDGRLRFGVWIGNAQVIDTAKAYNDGKWHHVVAEQSADGMRLYVDNELTGTNPTNTAQNYSGYWRVGGDNTWGGASSNYFAGKIDEVAVYSKALSAAEVADHYGKGGGTVANAAPTAAFDASVSKRVVTFDPTASADSDGTIASYAWDFGDGATSTAAKPSHTYASVGDFAVKLTVTDDDGATGTVTKTVTTLAGNAPTAAFTSSVTKQDVAFDGSGSADSDGTIASYAWDFGDGGTSAAAKPSHTFTTAGDHTVTLTVTDDSGLTGAVSKTVTTVGNAKPTAAFTSSVAKLAVSFDGSGSTDSDGTVASYAWDFGDGTSSTAAKPSHTYAAAGDQTVKLTVTDDGGATDSVTRTVTTVGNAKPTAAFTSSVAKLAVSFDGSGSTDSDGTVASYAWDFGDGTSSTAAKPSHTYAAGGDQTVKLTVTDDGGATDSVTKTVTTVGNAKPTAAFTSSVTGLAVSFDGSGSTDSDGTVASYAWDFGDGASSTAAKPSHTYAAGGDQTVKLTVTDDGGATDSVTKTVTTVAPAGPLAADAFSRTTSNGWGDADTGGTWTRYGTASAFSVASGTGQIKVTTPGAGPRIALDSLASTSSDVTVKISADKLADGGGQFVSVGARTIGTNDYRAKVKIASNGVLTLYLVKVVGNAETALSSVTLGTAYTYTAGGTLNVRVQATGTTPTTVRAKVWKSTQTEPATWQLSSTDSTDGLQKAGGVGLVAYLATTVTNSPVTVKFDDFSVTTVK